MSPGASSFRCRLWRPFRFLFDLIVGLSQEVVTGPVPGPIVFAFAALLTPFVASGIALAVQGLAIVLFWVLGAVVGLIVWIQVTFAGVWLALEKFKQLLGLAEHSEAVAGAAGGLLGVGEGRPLQPPPSGTP